jgi:hypothetical protein
MVNKLAIAVFGLAVICTSQSWAGSSGPGWASRLNETPAQQADTVHKQDLAAAKYCQAHPQVQHTLLACRQALARYPEMFANSTSATPH